MQKTLTLIITDKPKRWNDKMYTIVTLMDMVEDKKKSPNFSRIIIDDNITAKDVALYENTYKNNDFVFYNEVKKYMNNYSILIKPQYLHQSIDKDNAFYLLGSFRFNSNIVYNIYSINKSVDLSMLFNTQRDVLKFKKEKDIDALLHDEKEEMFLRAKQKKYAEKHVKPVEIVTENIRSVREYSEFIKNRDIFINNFIKQNIFGKSKFQDFLNNSKYHKYSNIILEKISNKYKYTEFPYSNEKNPLSIYFVIILHNRIKTDPTYEKKKDEIAATIGRFDNQKGVVIQSVTFTAIPDYDPVILFKINNNDKYFIWMKPEDGTTNSLKMYESRINSFQFIKNNLMKNIQPPKTNGGRSTKKCRKHYGSTTQKVRDCKNI